MAGVKGKSGGARPGAGAKPQPKPPPAPPIPKQANSLEFLRAIVDDEKQDIKDRLRAAITLSKYESVKTGDKSKRELQADAAKDASKGKFAAASPPLKIVGNT